MLIKPIEDDLKQAKAQTLMVSLDGALRYLPLAALYDGKHYVAENYRVVMYNEAAKDKLKDAATPDWTLAGLGLSDSVDNQNPLPAVPAELEGIVKKDEQDGDGVIPGVVHLNAAFDKEVFLDVLDQSFPVIHIASHFVLKPGNEHTSYLLLGNGDHLTLANIKEEDFDFGAVDLITLSACNTAMDSARANGQEIEGFGTLAQKQGAKTVLATLWSVADTSTGLFMQSLYARKIAHPELTKAEILQQVQREFITGKTDSSQPAGPARGIEIEREAGEGTFTSEHAYAHPYYWAPFIMMGNWL